jgi:hypothetical protein
MSPEMLWTHSPEGGPLPAHIAAEGGRIEASA